MADKKSKELFSVCLGQIARMWRAEIDRRLSPHGLTEARWRTLLHLSRMNEPVTQKELATAVGVQGPTLVRTLDWLEAEGLIERRSIAGDRRAKSIHLIDKAAPDLANIQSVAESLRNEIFAGLDEADIDICLRVFKHIAEKLGSAPMLHAPHDNSGGEVKL